MRATDQARRAPAAGSTSSRPAERGRPLCTGDSAGPRRAMADSDRARSAHQAREAVLHQCRERLGIIRRGPPRDSQGGRRAGRRPLAIAASTPFATDGLGVRRSSTARPDTQLEFDGHGLARRATWSRCWMRTARRACGRTATRGWRWRMPSFRACPPIPSCF